MTDKGKTRRKTPAWLTADSAIVGQMAICHTGDTHRVGKYKLKLFWLGSAESGRWCWQLGSAVSVGGFATKRGARLDAIRFLRGLFEVDQL